MKSKEKPADEDNKNKLSTLIISFKTLINVLDKLFLNLYPKLSINQRQPRENILSET